MRAVELGTYGVVTAELNDVDRFEHQYARPVMKTSQAFFDDRPISAVRLLRLRMMDHRH